MEMDIWKYFGITHTDHTVMNPMSLAKTEEIIECLRLPDAGRVLDVACGKAEFLCRVAARYPVTGIGIAGTSGKSTVTGMVASILDADDRRATVINGGIITQYVSRKLIGNARCGSGGLCLAELDESDGSIRQFFPAAGVITNISKDHKPLSELRVLFQQFIDQTSGPLVLNADCPESVLLKAPELDAVRRRLRPS